MPSPFQKPIPPAGSIGRESGVVERIRNLIGVGDTPAKGEIFFGDDAAVLLAPTGKMVVACTDAAVMGVHLDPRYFGAHDLGWRAMAATLSDLAAMGSEPWRALVTVIAPEANAIIDAMEGAQAAAQTYGTTIVGGDVSSGSELSVSVTALGLSGPSYLTRAGARPGDVIFVTGPLGGSAAGLRYAQSNDTAHPELIERHGRPRPRFREGRCAVLAGASAAIDTSDGLGLDLERLCESSGVGAALDLIPVIEGAQEHEALSGGEDYELIITTSHPDELERIFQAEGLDSPIPIGVITEAHGVYLNGALLKSEGYEHFSDEAT
jgi:thiamine-monophosphate kinase